MPYQSMESLVDDRLLPVLPFLDNGRPLTKEHLRELAVVRTEIEMTAAALAARRAADGQLSLLAELLTDAENVLHDDSMLGAANRRFHLELVRASQNTVLATLHESVMSAMEKAEQEIFSRLSTHRHDHREHASVLGALMLRDPAAARRQIKQHLEIRHSFSNVQVAPWSST